MWTTKDWLARAAESSDATALGEAEAVVRRPDEWLEVARAWRARGKDGEARRCVDSALTLANGEQWPTRRAAELLLELGDRDAAALALDGVAARLSPGTPVDPLRSARLVGDWVRLARAYRDLMGDDAAVRRCIDRARDLATSAADLADAAEGRVELLSDLDGARALLERAEALARATEPRALWGVAITWREWVGDHARARAILDSAVAESTRVVDLTAFATAMRSLFADEAAVHGALLRAESCATSAGDWLGIAAGYFEGGEHDATAAWDTAGVMRALTRAAHAQPTDAERVAIATALRDWLGGAVLEGVETPPTARAPELALPKLRTLAGWDASEPRALLHRLRARLTDAQVQWIAQADYGSAWHQHERALRPIVETGLVPWPLTWYPREVLELRRWETGAAVDHVARAFACAVLVLDGVDRTSQTDDGNSSLAALVESSWALGLDDELEQQLVWLAEVATGSDAAWPMLALALSRARRAPDDARLPELIEQLVEVELQHDLAWGEAWLYRTTNYDQRFDLWRALVADALHESRALSPALVGLARRLATA